MFQKMIAAWPRLFADKPVAATNTKCGTYLGLKLMGVDYPEEDNSAEYQSELISMQREDKQKQVIERLKIVDID